MSDELDMEIERTLFDAALELTDPALREAFLDKTCAADPALRARLGALLAAHLEAVTFFDFVPTASPPLSDAPPPVAKPPPSPVPGADPVRIGRYRIIRRLGEGGCGVVYLAEQDEPVRRQVALKIIRLGMDTERVIARFALERQALAMMDHPHIARVFDAGATETGRPYFVMELVTGQRITTHCDERRLTVRERLELFIHVCLAVQHAHQKGIIHRDLKPSNVLVVEQDGAPSPKIIDFGVAKAISDHPSDDPADTLAPEQFIGTPAYMSPEQAEPGRGDVDTRTDIYGLGALLCELLAGRPPFDFGRVGAADLDVLRRTLRETVPPPPSVLLRRLPLDQLAGLAARYRCPPGTLLTTLRRDLDWVVMHALEKDRSRRYATIQELVIDLRRYLDDQPVAARPPSLLYQGRKLVRRHRGPFAAGAMILASLIGGLAVSTSLYVRERTALREQTRLRAIAEDSEKISRAVFLLRDNKLEEANTLLSEVRHPPDHPSFEALTAYRQIGDWLACHQHWAEAAERFSVVERVGRLDTWAPVTLDHQSYGVALLMSGNVPAFERFREEHARRFATVTNGDAVARVLKTCLLRPTTPDFQRQLEPLGQRVETWLHTLPPKIANGWATIPVALWHYREGDLPGARQAARPGYDSRDHESSCIATLRIITALCDLREGRAKDAAALLTAAHADLAAKFAGDLSVGDGTNGYWYDWAFAAILLQEADQLAAAPRA